MRKRNAKLIQLVQKAEAYLDLAEYSKAEKVLKDAIEIDPDDPEPHYLIGEVFCKQERFSESINSLIEANRLMPKNPRILHLLGWATFMAGDSDLGRKFMEKALKILPDDTKILCDLAVLENKETNESQAKKYVLTALNFEPDNPMAQEVLAAINYFSLLRSKLTKKSN